VSPEFESSLIKNAIAVRGGLADIASGDVCMVGRKAVRWCGSRYAERRRQVGCRDRDESAAATCRLARRGCTCRGRDSVFRRRMA